MTTPSKPIGIAISLGINSTGEVFVPGGTYTLADGSRMIVLPQTVKLKPGETVNVEVARVISRYDRITDDWLD